MMPLAAMMSTGTSELSTETFSAVVYCRPTYCSAVNSAPPTRPSQSRIRQLARIAGQSRFNCGHRNGVSTRAGMSQRATDMPTGGTCPAMARPIT